MEKASGGQTDPRNKQSGAAIDLHTEEGRVIVRRLAGRCDLVIENFRPGRLDSRGLGYDALAAENPRIVLVQGSGFGQTGPRATAAGFGSIGEAYGGIRHTTGDPHRAPARTGISLGDSLLGTFAVIGGLAASSQRAAERSWPRGRRSTVRGGLRPDGVITCGLRARRGNSWSVWFRLAWSGPVQTRYATRDEAAIVIAANADGRVREALRCDARPRLVVGSSLFSLMLLEASIWLSSTLSIARAGHGARRRMTPSCASRQRASPLVASQQSPTLSRTLTMLRARWFSAGRSNMERTCQ